MRGGFVACFGGYDREALDRVVDAIRWHGGPPEQHSRNGFHVALLVDPLDGPTIDFDGETTRVVHGAEAGSLEEFERHGHRFAAIESEGRRLVASRDPMGLCPLFYRVHGGALWLSTEVAPLVALGRVDPDFEALSAQIALVPYEAHTGWSGIFRVLPGHRLLADTELRVHQTRYWQPARFFGSYRGTRVDAEQELSARLTAAVERCLDEKSGVLVSGGLDSTAIALAAGANGRRPRFVHVAFPQYDDAKEDHHARAVAEAVGVELEVVPGSLRPWHPEQDLLVSSVPYMTPPQLVGDTALSALADRGVRTALDGNDGDGVLGYLGREWGELVLTGRVGRLVELMRSYGFRTVAHGVLNDLVPPALRLRGLRRRPPLRTTYLQGIERYFDEPIRSRMRRIDHEGWRQPLGEWRARQLRQVMPVTTIRMEEHEVRGASHGLDMRHPFADRELVEFLISLPASIKSDPFRSKALLRSALAEKGPNDVLQRADKSPYSDVLSERVRPERCLEWIRDSGIELPLIDYSRLYSDAESDEGVPLLLLVFLARAHVFAAGGGA